MNVALAFVSMLGSLTRPLKGKRGQSTTACTAMVLLEYSICENDSSPRSAPNTVSASSRPDGTLPPPLKT